MAKNFKLKLWNASQRKLNFIKNFSTEHDQNVVRKALMGGMSIKELKELGFDPQTRVSLNQEAAVFARTEYKCSHKIAKRIVSENFDDDQIDVVITSLLLPTFELSEEKLLDEILYAKFSIEEMIDWLVENQT